MEQFAALSPARQLSDLAALYLLLEGELNAAAPQRELRGSVAKHFGELLAHRDFALIFAPPGQQELLLCRQLLLKAVGYAVALLGTAGNDSLRSLATWLEATPNATLPAPFDLVRTLPGSSGEWVALFFRLAREFYLYLEAKLGENRARGFFERSYNEISEQYGRLETFPVVVNLLPEKLLDSEKIGKLNRSQIQKILLQKLTEMNGINNEIRAQYAELDHTRRELVAARDELEQRVAERTAQLSATNRHLEEEIAERQRAEQELRLAKEEAELANRAKSEFLANTSHELRTPLNAIIGFSELIKNHCFGPIGHPQYESYIDDIHGSGVHLLSIINDILDMARVEAGKAELNEAEIDVAHAIAGAVRLVRARAKGIELQVIENPDVPLLYADERLLRQILLNLLSNAIKFTPAGGKVTATAAVEPTGELAIRITDTGIGMAAEDLPTVLKPFGQIDSTLSRKHGGTGLGLPLAKSFAELHGGTLTLESTVGVGTTAIVRFPPDRLVSAVGSNAPIPVAR